MDSPPDQNAIGRKRVIDELSLLLPLSVVQFVSGRVDSFKPYVTEHEPRTDAIRIFPNGSLLVRGDRDAATHVNRLWQAMASAHIFHTYIDNNASV